MLAATIYNLTKWMMDTNIHPVLADMVEEYLYGQGEINMSEYLALYQEDCVALAVETDLLRRGGFVDGRITGRWIDISNETGPG